MIEVKELSHHISDHCILNKISFRATEGKLLAIIGPNGAGKSTLLRLICKELKCQSGEIYIHEKSIDQYSLKQLAKFRAVLAQNNQVSNNFTVEEIIMMGRYPHYENHPTSEDESIVQLAIDEMGLQSLKDRSIFSLSGGEQQRTHLARILAQIMDQEQGILILDEPINGLDIQYQQIILEKAKKMAQKNFTVICILHDINFASKYADNILLMKNGKKVALGTPCEVITEENLIQTYRTEVKIFNNLNLGYPLMVPIS